MLLLKLTIVPLALLALGLAERRHGPRIAGWLAGIPVVGGPLLAFVTLGHGPVFGAHAALGAWFGIVPWLGFAQTYAVMTRWRRWPSCLLVAGLAWVVLAELMALAQTGPRWLQILPLLSYGVAVLAYPRRPPSARARVRNRWDLPVRMLAGAVLTLLITQFGGAVGPHWSGTLTVFPVMGSIIAISNHTQYGRAAVEDVVAGMSMGLSSIGAFTFVLHLTLAQWGAAAGFALALVASTLAHVITFLLARRMHAPVPSEQN